MDLIIVVLALIATFFLSLFTYFKNPKSITNRLFFFFAISVAVYNFINYLALHQSSDEATIFWIRTVMFVAFYINLFLFLLIAAFPKPKIGLKPTVLWVLVIFTVLLSPLAWTKLIFEGVKPLTTQPIPGKGMPLFMLHTGIFIIGALFNLIRKFRKARGIEKIQIKLFLLGLVMMFVSILITNLFFVVFLGTTAYVGLLPIYTLVFISFVSYAIIKHRFLDIRLVVARTVSYSLLVIILGVFYAVSVFFVSSYFLPMATDRNQLLVLTALALIIALTFQSLRRWLERITDHLFFKERYDSEDLLGNLSQIMASTLILKELTEEILKKLFKEMKISRGAFILIKDHQILEVESFGYQRAPDFNKDQVETLMKADSQGLVFEELPEGKTKNLMRQLNLTFSIILEVKEKKIGLLVLGEKSSGDIYSNQDIEILEILSPQLAVAIQNAQAYEEIKRFSVTLKEKVDQATRNLKKANAKLQELSVLKDEFVSVASHELRAPMTTIKGYISMVLEGDGGKVPPKIKGFLKEAYEGNERMIRLVNNMLNVSRIESGRLVMNLKDIQIEEAIEDVVKDFQIEAKKHGLKLEYQRSSKKLPKVRVDPDRIREVIANLVGNAINFTVKGQVVVRNKLEKGMVVTEFEDTGVGISPQSQKGLFKKFSQVNATAAPLKKGSGLGLYICKVLIDEFGGKIWLKSKVGQGTTFFFSLPAIGHFE